STGREAVTGPRHSVRFVRLPTEAKSPVIRKRRSNKFGIGIQIRVGRASRRRIRAGGPLALGRPSATKDTWREIRAQVLARARWACQACGLRTRLEVHHLVKRAQGGSDFDLDRLVALCRPCHAQTDAPYVRGRLVITPSGGGRFMAAVVRAPSKWAVRALRPTQEGTHP